IERLGRPAPPIPLALPVRILRVIGRLRGPDCDRQRGGHNANQTPIQHRCFSRDCDLWGEAKIRPSGGKLVEQTASRKARLRLGHLQDDDRELCNYGSRLIAMLGPAFIRRFHSLMYSRMKASSVAGAVMMPLASVFTRPGMPSPRCI